MNDKVTRSPITSMLPPAFEVQDNLVPMVVEQSARGERAYDITHDCSRNA